MTQEATEMDELAVAASTQLPESIESSENGHSIKTSRSSKRTASSKRRNSSEGNEKHEDAQTYMDKIKALSATFPHLRNIKAQSRRAEALIDCYEVHEGQLKSLRTFSEDQELSAFLTKDDEKLEDFLKHQDEVNSDMTIIVATDLSTGLIECLGSHFHMNPEVFEEHLINSGWRGNYADQESHTWRTRSVVKDYTSIKWYRPVRAKRRALDVADYLRDEMFTSGASYWQPVPNNFQGWEIEHRLRYIKNIVRGQWGITLPCGDDKAIGSVLSAWEERATVWSELFQDHTTVLVLLDPLPVVTETVSAEEPEAMEAAGFRHVERQQLRPHSIFRQFEPRHPPIAYDSIMSLDRPHDIDQVFFDTETTALSLRDWLRSSKTGSDVLRKSPFYPLESLFSIVEKDTLDVLHFMNLILKELARDFLDETKIQARLIHWRGCLGDFDSQLTAMEENLQGYASFLVKFASEQRVSTKKRKDTALDKSLNHCLKEISLCRQRTNKSSKLLMANITILESKRGIAEAESVARLTELAFFFIPLTFSASIFSMQVRELSSPDLSISAFFALAVTITAGSYVLRLSIRSSLLVNLRHRLLKDIRESSGIQPGLPIPTRAYLSWIGDRLATTWVSDRLGPISCIIGSLASITLLAALWSRPLQKDLKVASTLSILSLWIPLLGFTILYLRTTKKRKPSHEDH